MNLDNLSPFLMKILYSKSDKKIFLDINELKPGTCKIIQIGRLRKKTFAVLNNNGKKLQFIEIKSKEEFLKDLMKLKEKSLINEKEYQSIRSSFLNL